MGRCSSIPNFYSPSHVSPDFSYVNRSCAHRLLIYYPRFRSFHVRPSERLAGDGGEGVGVKMKVVYASARSSSKSWRMRDDGCPPLLPSFFWPLEWVVGLVQSSFFTPSFLVDVHTPAAGKYSLIATFSLSSPYLQFVSIYCLFVERDENETRQELFRMRRVISVMVLSGKKSRRFLKCI